MTASRPAPATSGQRETCECGHDRGYHGNADGQTGWQARCAHPDCECEDFVADPTACDSCGSRDPYECYDGCGCPDCDDEDDDDDVPAAAAVSGGQPTDRDGLREQIARTLGELFGSPDYPYPVDLADAILALPAVARLLAAEEAVRNLLRWYGEAVGRYRAAGDTDAAEGVENVIDDLRRALDGTQ